MAPPDWAVRLVRAGRGLLFLDELSTAPPAVQAALLRVVLERRVGALQLPAGAVRIVAAANPRVGAADGWELSPPLANRFVHLYWMHDRDVVVRGTRRDLAACVAAACSTPDGCRRRWRSRGAAVCRVPGCPAGADPPAAEHGDAARRCLAVAAELGDGGAARWPSVRRPVRPAKCWRCWYGVRWATVPASNCWPPSGPDGPAGPGDAPGRSRPPPSCPSGATSARRSSTAVVAAVGRRPERSRWDAAWAVLARALETGAPDLRGRPGDRRWRRCGATTGRCRRHRRCLTSSRPVRRRAAWRPGGPPRPPDRSR